MFVPFVFTLDTLPNTEDYFHWGQFYMYAGACVRNKWPIISHERYFKHLSQVEEIRFGTLMQDIASYFCMSKVPTTEDMLALKVYPIPQTKEDALIADYTSQFDCWVNLLKRENLEFEQIIGELLDKITSDFGEKPEGILTYEYLPKGLLNAAKKREIPVIFQTGGIVRPPFAPSLNSLSLINDNSAKTIKLKYNRFLSENASVPMLSHKGLLRLFASKQYTADIHNIDKKPEYDVGVLHNNMQVALHHTGEEYVSDQELSIRAKARYDKVLIRTRPGFESTTDALDDSPTCFHFCCKCKRVLGFMTKGMFEAMLAGRIPHEYGSFIFTEFCNHGIEHDSEKLASVELLSYIMFGLCTPFAWLIDPGYLRFLLSNPSEKELYMRSFNYYTQSISKEDLELYYMTSGREYRLGDLLHFTSGHKPHEYAAYYCLGGLHRNGEICTWSNGEGTSFEVDLVEPVNEPLTISVVLYEVAMDWNSPNPAQKVTCEVNGTDCGTSILVPGKKYLRFTIPAECVTDKLQIIFRYSYLHNDGDLKLGIAFEQMYISRSGQRFIEDTMSNEIAALGYKVSELDAQNSQLEAHNSELETYSAGLKAQISNLDTQITELNVRLQSIYGSRSWRLGHGIMEVAAKIVPHKK